MANADFLRCIQFPADKSPGEILLMVLEHCLKYTSSSSEMSNILKLINITFWRLILPYTRSTLNNILNPKHRLEFYGICPICCKYIGRINYFKSPITCNVCSEVVDINNPSSSNVFVIIDPSEKNKLLIEENQEYNDYVVKERVYHGKKEISMTVNTINHL